MSESKKPYTLAEDEKSTPIMVYTMTSLSWGDLVTKQLVRVNTFLRTLVPDYVTIYDARSLSMGSSGPDQAIAFPEFHIRTPKVIGFHLLPPASEPPDYDPAEENRRMVPVTAMVGPFRFDGTLRMATIATLGKYLEVTSSEFISIYDAAASCPGMPSLGAIRSPLVLIRRDVCSFSPRV